jgi:hypothetical protein
MGAATGALGAVLAGIGADFNPRQSQGILQEPAWDGVQHQHQMAQPVQSVQQHTQHINNSINMSGTTVADPAGLKRQVQEAQNSRYYTASGGMPQSGVGSP